MKHGLNRMSWIKILIVLFISTSARSDDFLLVVGEPGEANYAATFKESAEIWRNHFSKQEQFKFTLIGQDESEGSDLLKVQTYFADCDPDSENPLWIVLHGHGTHDGKKSYFNLRGQDVAVTDFETWLKPLTRRPLVFINSSAASSPFMGKLAGKNRIVITATETTDEDNYSYFGEYLAKSLQSADADLDRDGSLSLLEAFLHSSRSVEAHYLTENRMATEHAMMDDNADGKGTPVDFFRGMNATKKAKSAKTLDGENAHQLLLSMSEEESKLTSEQRKQRAELEKEIADLRRRRKELGDQAYYQQLEKAALKLSEIYHDGETEHE